MSDYAVLQILDELEARLRTMTVGNEYLYSFSKIERARLTPFKSGDLPAVNYWPAFDELVERKYRYEKRSIDLRVEAYTVTRDEPFTDVSFKLGNSVWTVLNRATTAPKVSDDWSPNLGGLLTNFDVKLITPAIGEGESPWCGSLLSLAAVYKVDSYNHTIIP